MFLSVIKITFELIKSINLIWVTSHYIDLIIWLKTCTFIYRRYTHVHEHGHQLELESWSLTREETWKVHISGRHVYKTGQSWGEALKKRWICLQMVWSVEIERLLAIWRSTFGQRTPIFRLLNESKTNPEFNALILYFSKLNNRPPKYYTSSSSSWKSKCFEGSYSIHKVKLNNWVSTFTL